MKNANLHFAGMVLGGLAFKAGKKSVPFLDMEAMELIGKNNGFALDILKGWAQGWHEANLSAPI